MNGKLIVRIAVIAMALMMASSCMTAMLFASTSEERAKNYLNQDNVRLSGKTVQYLNEYCAMMVTDEGDVVCVVRIFDEYYDGMRINEKFKKGGVYQYKNSDGMLRHVPIFINSKQYGKLKDIAKDLEAKNLQEQAPYIII